MGRQITGDEFGDLLTSFTRAAFRLEAQPQYAVGEEREALGRFLAGEPATPADYGWWQEWLDMIRDLAARGRTVSRVRVLAVPLTGYQRWELHGDPWHAEAGEQISYLPRSRAVRLGLPLAEDWWLLDDARLIVMRFTAAGEAAGCEYCDDPGDLAPYLRWRDLAVRNATTAEEIAAA